MRKLNVEPEKIYENMYDIITSEIDDLMGIGGNIVKYRCRKCKKSKFNNETSNRYMIHVVVVGVYLCI